MRLPLGIIFVAALSSGGEALGQRQRRPSPFDGVEFEAVDLGKESRGLKVGALEEQSDLDDRLTAHLGQQEAVRTASAQADDELASAVADIDAEVERLEPQRAERFATLDDRTGRRYGQLLESLGSAVGQLEGSRCSGCHLDLSAAEVDTARDESAASGFTECPQCGRLLVV